MRRSARRLKREMRVLRHEGHKAESSTEEDTTEENLQPCPLRRSRDQHCLFPLAVERLQLEPRVGPPSPRDLWTPAECDRHDWRVVGAEPRAAPQPEQSRFRQSFRYWTSAYEETGENATTSRSWSEAAALLPTQRERSFLVTTCPGGRSGERRPRLVAGCGHRGGRHQVSTAAGRGVGYGRWSPQWKRWTARLGGQTRAGRATVQPGGFSGGRGARRSSARPRVGVPTRTLRG